MQRQEGQISWLSGRADGKAVGLGIAVVVLLGLVALGIQRELRIAPASPQAATPMTERGVDHTPLSPADEVYAAALWAIHSQVKQDAVRMTFAGLSYQMKDIGAGDLGRKVEPLAQAFRQAQQRMAQLTPSPAMQRAHDLYLGALKRYEQAAKLMTQFSSDSKGEHLIEAQQLSQLASEDLLRVSDVLWPGEHKPN